MKIHYLPYKQFTIEKADDSGIRHRYLCGIASGLDIDAHGEKMSEKCISKFHDQANSGQVLLYPSAHGIKDIDDIGYISKSEIQPNGDWYIECRLYDESDGVGQTKLEKIDDVWKQMNGLPPYKSPKEKGFSIEGIVNGEHGVIMNSMTGQKILNDIDLDGVCLVPRPAYQTSIASAVYKALGEILPEAKKSITDNLKKRIEQDETEETYFKSKWKYQNALEEMIDVIMNKKNKNNDEKQAELKIIFDEYTTLMIYLLIKSSDAFSKWSSPDEDEIESSNVEKSSKLELLKHAYMDVLSVRKSVQERLKILERRNVNNQQDKPSERNEGLNA